MGYTSWSDDFYKDRATTRAVTGAPTFAYDSAVKTGTTAFAVHPDLDIRGKVRESRDSADHPESVAIGVVFDVTGSMAEVPVVLQKQLPKLMGMLLRKGYVKDPQVLFSAVGDYNSDRVPLQVGQFESGIEMEDDMTKFVLEGGGGGSYEESYATAMWYFANRTSIDCWEKRGKKGYLFVIGDEKPYPHVTSNEVEALTGVPLQQKSVPVEDIISTLQEKYNVFFVIPVGTSHFHDPVLKTRWVGLLGAQNVIMLEQPETVCEAIGLAIGLCEGTAHPDSMAADLADVGADARATRSVVVGLDALAKSTALAPKTDSALADFLPASGGRSPTNTRL